jgi:hypothetical protein
MVRNSLLTIYKEGSNEGLSFGLMQRITESQEKPWELDLSKKQQKPLVLVRSPENKLEHGLFLASVLCEVDNQMRMLRAVRGRDTAELKWDQKVEIRLEPRDGEYIVTAKRNGKGTPSKLYIHSLIAYTKVGDKAVEVWRLERK